MQGSFKIFGVIKYKVVVDAYLFDLVLKLIRPLTALDHLLDLLFWLLVIAMVVKTSYTGYAT